MKRLIAAGLVLVASTIGAWAQDGETGRAQEGKSGASTEDAKTGIQWLKSYEDAKAIAKKEDKRLFIVFSTSWCGPCKWLDANVWSKDEMAEALKPGFVPLYLDGDKDVAEKKEFAVTAYPTILLAKADGEVIARQVGNGGMGNPKAWAAWVELQIEGARTLPELLKEAETTTDPDKLIEIANKLVASGRGAEAAELFARAERALDAQAAELTARSMNLKLQRAQLLTRQNKDSADLREVMDALVPKLVAEKDERIVALAMNYCNIVARQGTVEKNDPLRARQMMLDLQDAFPEHAQFRAFRNFAAMYAHLGGDDETALAEMKAMIAEDEENNVDDPYTKRARVFVGRLEKGERYR